MIAKDTQGRAPRAVEPTTKIEVDMANMGQSLHEIKNIIAKLEKHSGEIRSQSRHHARLALTKLEAEMLAAVESTPKPPASTELPNSYRFSASPGTGVSSLTDHEMVANPNESYRAPSKIHFSNLLDRAGLDFRRVVEVYSRGYDSRTTLSEQQELIGSLNNGQNDVIFVLIQPKPERKWWEKLFRLRQKKDTIAKGPCGCYPCNCELFCHKQSLLPENTRR